MLRELGGATESAVSVGASVTGWFTVRDEVRQGSVVSITPLSST